MTPADVIKKAIPGASFELCEYIIWNRTAFPFVRLNPQDLYRVARRYRRAYEHGVFLCDFCDNIATQGEDTCLRCRTRLTAPREKKYGTYTIPVSNCLGCGKELDAASETTKVGPPKPGSVTVCLACGHIMALDDNLQHRNLTDDEMLKVAGNPQILEIQRARESLKQK